MSTSDELLNQLHRFEVTGLIGLSTAAAAAVAASGPMLPGLYSHNRSVLTVQLEEMLGKQSIVPARQARQIAKKLELTADRLMVELLPIARRFARAPISHYRVGVVGKGKKGDLYFGYNIEFLDVPLNYTVHAEQAIIAQALMRGETSLEAVALFDTPSGLCRQFLNELPGAGNMRILTPSRRPVRLRTLLPNFFGPEDLGQAGGLLGSSSWKLELKGKVDSLAQSALEAARKSYAPYSQSPSGIALETTDGKHYCGGCAENAAFNPSMSPMQGAVVNLVADGRSYGEIARAVLVEREGAPASQAGSAQNLLQALQPKARLTVLKAR